MRIQKGVRFRALIPVQSVPDRVRVAPELCVYGRHLVQVEVAAHLVEGEIVRQRLLAGGATHQAGGGPVQFVDPIQPRGPVGGQVVDQIRGGHPDALSVAAAGNLARRLPVAAALRQAERRIVACRPLALNSSAARAW